MKSRAIRMMETVLREEEPVSNTGIGGVAGPGVGQAPFAGAAPDSYKGGVPQPDVENPEAGDLKELVTGFISQPDGMAALMAHQSGMMERYMDEADKDVYTPESPEDKDAIMSAHACMQEAMGHINKVQRYTA